MTNDARSADSAKDSSSSWAAGLALFAGIILILAGFFQAIAGMAALFKNEFYVATQKDIFEFDVTTWGWIHLLGGLLVAFAGFSIVSGRTWARVFGIVIATVSALVNFTFIPYYPLWSLVVVALDVFVIWALCVYSPDAS